MTLTMIPRGRLDIGWSDLLYAAVAGALTRIRAPQGQRVEKLRCRGPHTNITR
jgi:hypothetical protein